MGESDSHINVEARRRNNSDEGRFEDACDDLSWDATRMSSLRKFHVFIAGFTCTFNGNFGSSMPSGALDALADHFNITNRLHLTLLNSCYMIGFVVGPPIFGPLSEYIGRRPVLIGTFLGYLTFILACSGAPNLGTLIAFRLLGGINAAAPTTVLGGLYADIFDDPGMRGNAIAMYMTVTTTGPLIGPLISGFASSSPLLSPPLDGEEFGANSWRWPFWIAGAVAALGAPLVLALPETYAPVLRRKKMAAKVAREASSGVDEKGIQDHQRPNSNTISESLTLRKVFLRPMQLLCTELIVFSTSAYLTLAYGVFYLMFQAYPVVFEEVYSLPPGMAGLAYLPLVVGAIMSLVVFLIFTWYHGRQTEAGAAWAKKEIYRRLPLACIASPCMVIGLFWLGWTPDPGRVSAVVPAMSGIFFGCGFQLVFMGMLNHLTDVYGAGLSSSALAAASMTRSVGAVLLPLAAGPMYRDLGYRWAPSVLGFIALAMGLVPFVFIRFGDRLTKRGKTAQMVEEGG